MTDLKAVIFDYYETLAQLGLKHRVQLFDALARDTGVNLQPGQSYRDWTELPITEGQVWLGEQRQQKDGLLPAFRTFRDVWTERFGSLFLRWGVDVPVERATEAYIGIHASALVYPEVPDALSALGERYRLAVLSNADDDMLFASVAKNRLQFETVVSSEELRAYKPHVSLFNEACARLEVQPAEAAYVGDSPWADVEGARHAGLRAVWINRHGAEWPADIGRPEYEITSLAELAALL